MKKMKLRKWVKYLILILLNIMMLIIIANLLRNVKTVNDYRFNSLIIIIYMMIDTLLIYKIERK